VGLVGPTVYSIGADDTHIVVKQHEFDRLAAALSLPSFSKTFDDLR